MTVTFWKLGNCAGAGESGGDEKKETERSAGS